MRFVSAHFKNFRLLHDVSLDFSLDDSRPLTVIRGENGCGKTTTLDALRWLLYGSSSLPVDYRIADANRRPDGGDDVLIIAEAVFLDNFDTKYRIKRTVKESTESGRRTVDSMYLYELDDRAGWRQIENAAEVRLRSIMPEAIRDIFFTNGDDALVFIEAESGERRTRVEEALKEMLGIEIVEAALKHVRDVASDFNKAARRENKGSVELAGLNEDLASFGVRIEALKVEAAAAERLRADQLQLESTYQDQIESELRLGDREQLQRDLSRNRESTKRLLVEFEATQSQHADLLSDADLPGALLDGVFGKAWALLEGLKVEGEIPTNFSSILVQCVDAGECICGTSLEDGSKALKSIERILSGQREQDDTDNHLMDLRYECNRCRLAEPSRTWTGRLDRVRQRLVANEGETSNAQARERELETKLEALKDSKLNELRKLLSATKRAVSDASQVAAEARAEVKQLENQRREVESQQTRMAAQLGKQERYRAQLEVSSDVEHLLSEMRRHIVEKQIQDVSSRMSLEFLRMIGADEMKGAGITSAEITDSFDLVVKSQEGLLNPDTALNGASKRALTLAFILALSEVSEVAAPNVIDTPLGMMAGAVKRSVLSNVIARSSQPVLFLTSSEISGCEDLIEAGAGVQQTLTNTGAGTTKNHSGPVRTLRCDCGILSRCDVCDVVADFKSRGAN